MLSRNSCDTIITSAANVGTQVRSQHNYDFHYNQWTHCINLCQCHPGNYSNGVINLDRQDRLIKFVRLFQKLSLGKRFHSNAVDTQRDIPASSHHQLYHDNRATCNSVKFMQKMPYEYKSCNGDSEPYPCGNTSTYWNQTIQDLHQYNATPIARYRGRCTIYGALTDRTTMHWKSLEASQCEESQTASESDRLIGKKLNCMSIAAADKVPSIVAGLNSSFSPHFSGSIEGILRANGPMYRPSGDGLCPLPAFSTNQHNGRSTYSNTNSTSSCFSSRTSHLTTPMRSNSLDRSSVVTHASHGYNNDEGPVSLHTAALKTAAISSSAVTSNGLGRGANAPVSLNHALGTPSSSTPFPTPSCCGPPSSQRVSSSFFPHSTGSGITEPVRVSPITLGRRSTRDIPASHGPHSASTTSLQPFEHLSHSLVNGLNASAHGQKRSFSAGEGERNVAAHHFLGSMAPRGDYTDHALFFPDASDHAFGSQPGSSVRAVSTRTRAPSFFKGPSGVLCRSRPGPPQIVNVWADNLEEEFSKIRDVVERFQYIAMDTEFPGIVARPTGNCSDYNYKTVKFNVDLLKMIQLGITFADERGCSPLGTSTWQFNFKFDLSRDMYAQDSIDFLRDSGIDFATHQNNGIDIHEFGELIISSGLVMNKDVKWISFHGSYDFGYLLKLLTCAPLPDSEAQFFELLHDFFPALYDIKYLLKNCRNIQLSGGVSLQKVAEHLEVQRIGPQHHAGSDSLVTCQTFFRLMDTYFDNLIDDALFSGVIYGLGGSLPSSLLLSLPQSASTGSGFLVSKPQSSDTTVISLSDDVTDDGETRTNDTPQQRLSTGVIRSAGKPPPPPRRPPPSSVGHVSSNPTVTLNGGREDSVAENKKGNRDNLPNGFSSPLEPQPKESSSSLSSMSSVVVSQYMKHSSATGNYDTVVPVSITSPIQPAASAPQTYCCAARWRTSNNGAHSRTTSSKGVLFPSTALPGPAGSSVVVVTATTGTQLALSSPKPPSPAQQQSPPQSAVPSC